MFSDDTGVGRSKDIPHVPANLDIVCEPVLILSVRRNPDSADETVVTEVEGKIWVDERGSWAMCSIVLMHSEAFLG